MCKVMHYMCWTVLMQVAVLVVENTKPSSVCWTCLDMFGERAQHCTLASACHMTWLLTKGVEEVDDARKA
jgi:hypothetical protein